MTAIGKLLGSTTGQGYATSLVIHCGVLTSFWAASGWLFVPVVSNTVYGGRRQQAIALSIWQPGPESDDVARPEQPIVISPDYVRMEDRRFVYAPATADAPELASPESDVTAPVLPRRATELSNDELGRATVAERPWSAARRSAATPAVAGVAALPPAPIRFVGRPPRYPAEALARGWEGTVMLLVHLNENGGVVRVEIERSSGMGAADAEAVRTVQTWRAVPLHRGERLTARIVRKPVQFTLRDLTE